MTKAFLILWIVLSVLSLRVAFATDGRPGAEIRVGKWVGYLQVEGVTDAIAVTMDSYLSKPDDIRAFPTEVLLFKLSLGGYLSSEYETEVFDEVHYDFNQGLLALDEAGNEMVVSAVVYASPRLHMKGQVTLRSSGRQATLYLAYQTDEPGATGGDVKPPPLVPSLAGQYEGKCGEENTVLQLETGKGLTDESLSPSAGLEHYRITGTVGVVNGVCPPVAPPGRPSWCVDHAFSSATYDFFTGQLQLNGLLEADQCTREGADFTCRMGLVSKDLTRRGLIYENCRFHKVNSRITPFKVFPRRFHVSPSAAQNKELPAWAPPRSHDLIAALGGSFSGYLHHELLDRYQPLRLAVSASTSTLTPHIENQVFVSAIAGLSFGDRAGATYWTQPFDRRAFYLVPGFTLRGAVSDAFAQITRWRQGYLSGVWYSRAFGRVGTFELVKAANFPALDSRAKLVEDIAGEFRGPELPDSDGKNFIDVTFRYARQPRSADLSYLVFQGNYRLWAGGAGWPIQKINYGNYDLYTGAVSFLTGPPPPSEPSLITGYAEDADTLQLFWPNDRAWAVGIFDSLMGTFRRAAEGGR